MLYMDPLGKWNRISVGSEHLLGTCEASTIHISEVCSPKIQCEKFLTFQVFISSPSNIKAYSFRKETHV